MAVGKAFFSFTVKFHMYISIMCIFVYKCYLCVSTMYKVFKVCCFVSNCSSKARLLDLQQVLH